ncbi:MAG TPA: hypothetical protein ENI35_03705 [Candidatus Desulfofervidus auxilii]|uniref:Uncharacterized protein n=1 Tax=Desulfofervidus auxilii TaxID=1621989 RepID=A0A7C1VNL2_DESA2|nr:hypothetical protein [Candidatus Desulfofervidus auxilii]
MFFDTTSIKFYGEENELMQRGLSKDKRGDLNQVIPACRQTGKIERVFRELKSYFEIQPIYHYVPRRIKAHIFLCFLALLLEWEFTKRLKEMEPDIPPIR